MQKLKDLYIDKNWKTFFEKSKQNNNNNCNVFVYIIKKFVILKITFKTNNNKNILLLKRKIVIKLINIKFEEI